MSTNKNALIRYKVLDKCLRNPGRNYTLDDLIEECNLAILEQNPDSDGIQRRQIQYDIKDMESIFHIELAKAPPIGRKKVFKYLNSNFSIFNQKLNETDANQIKAAILALSKFEYDWADDLAVRLREQFNIVDDPRKIIEFEENEFLEGKEHIQTLYNAIEYKRVLRILYQKYQSEVSQEFIIHPYYLKQYNNRWFLIGDAGFPNFTNLPLDRIRNIEEIDAKYAEIEMDFKEEYFGDVVGVTVPNIESEKILIKVEKTAYDYIRTKAIHGSQTVIKENEDHFLIQLEVKPNFELESRLLSYGNSIEVIEPSGLREKLRYKIEKMLEKYVN